MKKAGFFFAVLSIFFFTCTLPGSIEITGNPEIRFSTNLNFSDIFAEYITDGFTGENNQIVECTKTKNQTFIIHMNLFDDVIGGILDSSSGEFLPIGDNFETTKDHPLTDSGSGGPKPISLAKLNENLQGFNFKKVYSKLFISGSDIVKELKIDLSIGTETAHLDKDTGFVPEKSGFNEKEWKEFTALPNRGAEIDLTDPLNSGVEIEIDYEVTLPAGRSFPKEWIIDDAIVQAELVIWIAFEFVAINECDHIGADLDLVNFMGEGGEDFFGRSSPDDEDSIVSFLDSMSLILEFSKDVFKGAYFYINSDNGINALEIDYLIEGEDLEIKFDEKTIKKINNPDYFPFAPHFLIHFDKDDEFNIQRDFNSNYIRFKAKVNKVIDL